MTAACCHMGDTYHTREWSRVTGTVFFPCCGPLFVAIDQPLVDVEEVDPHFMTATLIAFPETQRSGSSIHVSPICTLKVVLCIQGG